MEQMLTVDDVAALLGVPKATVYRWQHERTGPRSYKVGRHLRFRAADVEAWLEAHVAGGVA